MLLGERKKKGIFFFQYRPPSQPKTREERVCLGRGGIGSFFLPEKKRSGLLLLLWGGERREGGLSKTVPPGGGGGEGGGGVSFRIPKKEIVPLKGEKGCVSLRKGEVRKGAGCPTDGAGQGGGKKG